MFPREPCVRRARVPLTLVAAGGLAAAVAYEVMRVAGSGPWLLGPPPAGMWSHRGLLCGLFWWPRLVLYLFMACGKFLPVHGLREVSSRFLAPIRCFLGPGGEAGGCLSRDEEPEGSCPHSLPEQEAGQTSGSRRAPAPVGAAGSGVLGLHEVCDRAGIASSCGAIRDLWRTVCGEVCGP